ncbi:MAG: hypothetical protein JRE47_06540 [Deltaproteobacteria bacterium]|nr:hypothetical protein [Deltaproteobacteria bacterium]
MAELNEREKKLVVKIVYYGPALSGKTTNLMQLHEILNPARCGEFMVFETKGDRTLFFDLLPMLIKSESGFKIKIKLFTVPGQPAHDATRKEVLNLWQPTGLPITFSSALSGSGVKETFGIALKRTYLRLNAVYQLDEKYSVTEEDFLKLIES